MLDYELRIDSGNFDIQTIDKLMQLYGQAVEYYSGMNDEKYLYFTERIQNTLLKPEILKFMKETNNKDELEKGEYIKEREERKQEEKKLSREDQMKVKLQEHEKRKKERVEKLQKTNH